MPPKPNLVLVDEEEYVFSESITSVSAVATSKVKTSVSKPKSVSEPLIEDWISDSEDENKTEFKSKQRKPSFAKIEFVKSNEHVKTNRESVKKGNITTVRPKAIVSDNKGNKANAVKASGNPQLELQEKGVIDSGCSRHITGNKSYLSDYEEINGGFIAFGGDPKGGKITSKGKIKTGKLDFEDVYFVKELKFNLFSVSQMCDKKNSVLFTDTKCVVLSPDFKLLDENHVLLRFPRKDNMYNVDLKNIVPSGGRKPTLSFMRPFGYLVTILNTLDHLGTKENIDASQDGKKIVPDQKYILLPLLTSDPTLSKRSKDSPDVGFKPLGEEEKMEFEHLENENSEVPNTGEPRVNQEHDANVNSTNNINTISPTVNAADIENNVVDENIVYGCINDLNMPNL
ncbi:hypothetical protein Tco_1414444 [Tanacetum coccineum]